jgi:hypothetical protein
MRRLTSRGAARTGAMAASLVVLFAAIAVRAQQGAGAGGAGAAKPLVPLTAASLALHPELYMGETVALTGVVERMLTRTAFTVDQDKTKAASPKEVLILAPTLTTNLQPNTYVSIVGTVVPFDPADVARRVKGYTLDLSPDLVEKFRGQAIVIATGVINEEMTDLAKKVVPPPTPAEAAFDNVMKQVSPAAAALRTALDGSNLDATRQQTAVLKKAFIDTQLFFKDRGTADATGWAADAMKFADSVEQSAVAGKWDVAKTSLGSLNQLCTTCHAAHRERQDDGSYRVKG